MILARITAVSCLVVIVLAGVAGTIGYAQGNRLLSVQTGSMIPIFKPGDAILTRRVSFSALRPGQIISYRSSSQVVVSHRITNLEPLKGTVITKGDNTAQADLAVHQTQIIGRAVAVAPNLGIIMNWLHRPVGLLCAVYLPASLFIGGEIYRYLRQPVRTRYHL